MPAPSPPSERRHFLRECLATLAACALPATLRAQADVTEDLVAANRILAAEGVVDAYGHISVRNPRNPQRFFLARAVAAELVTARDILEFDLDCKPVVPTNQSLFIERFIHGEMYRARQDVNSVAHCHTPSLIPFGITDVPLRPTFGLAGFLAVGVPVFEIRKYAGMSDLLVRNAALGKALAQTVGDKPAALMRGHGAVVTGPSIPETVGRCVYMEVNARLQAQAMALGGKVTYVDPQEGRQSNADGYRRAWELWKRKAMAK